MGTYEEEAEALMRQQAEVRGDRDRLFAEASRLATVWTGLKMDGPDIVVLLTDPAPHEAALRTLLDHPDRVRFQTSRYTRTRLDDVHRQLLGHIDDSDFTSHGPGLEQVHITLHSGRAALAEQLHQRFGDALEITLGLHRYPLDPSRILEPPLMPSSTINLPALSCTVELDQDTWAPGDEISGQVQITNTGADTLTLSALATGLLLDSTARPVGTWNGIIALGLGLTMIAPGTRGTVHFLAGSDTSDPRQGAALPPGTYQLVVPLRVHDRTCGRRGHGRSDTLVTDPRPIRLRPATQH